MNFSDILTNVVKTLKSHSPEILTALGVSGVVATSYLTAKASFKANEVLEDYPFDISTKEKAKVIWKLYIPAGVSGALTIGCIIVSSQTTGRRTAAAVAAYSFTERAFSEYKEKVAEELGKGKEQKIRDEIVQERVLNNPAPVSREVMVTSVSGHVLCCELFTGRYFRSDMEMLRKAQNDLNVKVVNNVYVSLDEFYDLIGLSYTSNSSRLGWDPDRLMELEFSTVLSDTGEPCIAFDYNYIKPLK